MKRLRPLVVQAANWEPPVPRKHFYAMLMLTAMTLSAVALLPAPGDILERPLRLELPIDTAGTATNENNTDLTKFPITNWLIRVRRMTTSRLTPPPSGRITGFATAKT